MTSRTIFRPIQAANPGGIRAYVNVDYHDGFTNGIATYRSLRDGQIALLTRIWRIYHNLGKIALQDFCAEFFADRHIDLVSTNAFVAMRLVGPECITGYDDLALEDVRRAVKMAQAIAYIVNGPVPNNWFNYPRWLNPVDLLDIADDLGFWG